jgi:glycerophosphoryl diester phosphodiesterase
MEDAVRAGAALVEADVRLYRGRLEVRHLKSVGFLPLFWDRWRLATPWHRRLRLEELLGAIPPDTELMLDLKGSRKAMATGVLEALQPYLGTRRLTICARSWALLEPFSGLPVRCVHSIGTRRELDRFLVRFMDRKVDGVSIHERLLDPTNAAILREMARVLMTWPVNRSARARELLELGVHGLITDDAPEVAGLILSENAA